MAESIMITGAGMGGLAAGICGRLNGFRNRIFERPAISGHIGPRPE
jgi:2-polyprenyl-6-methoxyphenol hydroxylase-like FAD-dependent oxidoreductase